MAMGNKVLLIFLFTFATMIPSLWANIGLFDEVWQKRAEEARKMTIEAYIPNPEDGPDDLLDLDDNKNSTSSLDLDDDLDSDNSTLDLDDDLGSSNSTSGADDSDIDDDNDDLLTKNSTRRNLHQRTPRKYKGPCRATNPMDRCWRCRKNWARNRKRLAKCALGFGRKTTGGMAGRIYVVTDCSDDDVMNPKPGTLRHAVIQREPLWIIFAMSMNIRLQKELIMTSDKTIDGRGAKVHISHGAGITIQFIKNVIIHGIKIHHIVAAGGGMIRDSADHFGIRTNSDGDGISIFGSTNIWIDHVSMSQCTDGLIDAIQGSTAITISNSHFTNHNDAILLGASDSFAGDQFMQVTVAYNHFGQGLVQRMPRCRWGFFHVINNDYTHWRLYAIGGSKHPTIISQGNRFIAPNEHELKQVTKRDYATESEWSQWTWRSEDDLMMNGAFFVQSGAPRATRPHKKWMLQPRPGSVATRLTQFAGALVCRKGRPC